MLPDEETESFHTANDTVAEENASFYASALHLQEEVLDYDEDVTGYDLYKDQLITEGDPELVQNELKVCSDSKDLCRESEEGEVVSLPEEGECSDNEKNNENSISGKKNAFDSTEEGECEESDGEANKENKVNAPVAQNDASNSLLTPPLNDVDNDAEQIDETPWQRAMRQAKLRMKAAKERKAKETNHNEKKMNLELDEVSDHLAIISNSKGNKSLLTDEKGEELLSSTAILKFPPEYIPEEPKENEMLNDYYLCSCTKREDFLFLNGRDVVEVEPWQKAFFPAPWIRFFTQKLKAMKEAIKRPSNHSPALSGPENKASDQGHDDSSSDSSDSERDDEDTNSDLSMSRSSLSRHSSSRQGRRPYIAVRNRSPPIRRPIRKSRTHSSRSSRSRTQDYSTSRSVSCSRSHSLSPCSRRDARPLRHRYRSRFRRSSSSRSLSAHRYRRMRNESPVRSPVQNRGIDPALESRMNQWRTGGLTMSKVAKNADVEAKTTSKSRDVSDAASGLENLKESSVSPIKRGAHQGPITAGRSRSTSKASSASSDKSEGSSSSSSVSSSSSSSGSSSGSESSGSDNADAKEEKAIIVSGSIETISKDTPPIEMTTATKTSRQEIRMRVQPNLAKSKNLSKLQKRPASVFHPNDEDGGDDSGLAISSPSGKRPKLSVPNREEEEEVRRLQDQIERELQEQVQQVRKSSPKAEKPVTRPSYREVPPPVSEENRLSASKVKRSQRAKNSSEKYSDGKYNNPSSQDNRRDRQAHHRTSSPSGRRARDGADESRFHQEERQFRERTHYGRPGGAIEDMHLQRTRHGSPTDWSALHSSSSRNTKPPTRFPNSQRSMAERYRERDVRHYDYVDARSRRGGEALGPGVKHSICRPSPRRSPPNRVPGGGHASVSGVHHNGRKIAPAVAASHGASVAATMSAEKSAALKKRELLEKLRQVEDAIAKKRSKINSN